MKTLSDELVFTIVSRYCRKHEIYGIFHSCKRFCELLKPILWRSIELDSCFDNSFSMQQLDNINLYTRELEISDSYLCKDRDDFGVVTGFMHTNFVLVMSQILMAINAKNLTRLSTDLDSRALEYVLIEYLLNLEELTSTNAVVLQVLKRSIFDH